ncbi:hypothetical protein VTH06DRAFT_359 [Thermothelomyces fergusii]
MTTTVIAAWLLARPKWVCDNRFPLADHLCLDSGVFIFVIFLVCVQPPRHGGNGSGECHQVASLGAII